MHYISNTPTNSKKQCPLKEVLMTSWRRSPYALRDNSHCAFAAMRIMRENPTFSIVKIAGNACAAQLFEIRDINQLHKRPASPTHAEKLKMGVADSESGFLAINKFSEKSHLRLIGARRNPIFCRISDG
ncbi:hypothetical protein [Tardiphaga sp.]|jgi:hypothetical protein|uniref:hypothetical protein n=1 Tax=Tardiphaga sp. TaxID=1926292 RepID=UPI00261E312F|nr:hypothetical protein [Tardiphaga sp.]